MTQEEKAKRYNEAVKFAKIYHNSGDEDTKTTCETMFPALKESEDDRIRKVLIRFHKSTIDVDGIKGEDIIAWLEKQGEQKQDVNIQINPSEYINDMGGNGCYLKNVTQVSAWSEEDEKMLTSIIFSLAGFMGNEDKIDWLKSLKDRVLLQSRQEWSEEEEKMLDELYKFFDTQKVPVLKHSMNDYAKFIKLIKERVQPQPKQEWSEEDEEMIDSIIGNIKYLYSIGSCDNATVDMKVNWLKSLRHQPQWKPSDDEMKALAEALSLANNCGEENAFDLRTLYEQLKKLKG